MNKYLQGDLVVYNGRRFGSDLNGKLGEVCAPVHNQPGVYVVNFGEDYVMAGQFLAPFQGQLKPRGNPEDKPKKSKGGPKVSKRRGQIDEEEEGND